MIILIILICIILYFHTKKYNKSFKKKVSFLNKEDLILKKLNHPNIIKLLDIKINKNFKILYLKDDGLYPIGDFEPETVENPLRMWKNETKIKIITKQFLNAIEYIHSKNIIHNDIHPYNILYNPSNDKIIIIDFSEAIIGPKSLYYIINKKENFMPTSYYMAPEKLIPDKSKYHITNKVDIYSIGSILYVLLTGETLYSNIRPSKIINVLKNSSDNNEGINIESLSNYSNDCIDLLFKLLNNNPEKRISAKKALQHNWFKTL